MCVNRMIIHAKLKSTRWMNSCVTLFDIWYCTDIFIMQTTLIISALQIEGVSLQEWRQFYVHSHQQTKHQSSQGTQTFVDWNSSGFRQRQSPNHLAFESHVLLTVRLCCAAEHFMLAPTTGRDFHQLQQQISLWTNKPMTSMLSCLKCRTEWHINTQRSGKTSCSMSHSSCLWCLGTQWTEIYVRF